jgi:CDP-glycerol glycerophosphotransferase (TagB/SpsB family)
MKIDRKNPRHWVLLLRQAIYTLFAILVRPFTCQPSKPVVILYGHQLSGNLKALYTEWSKGYSDEFDLYCLFLDPKSALQYRAAGVRVLQCNRLRDMLQLTHASALISDHGLHLMTPLIRFTDILFIDVWHGIPFKGFTPDDFRLQHRYDEVWVSSPLLKQIYQDKFGFRAEIVHAMGYARADKLFLRQPPDPLFRERASIPAGNKVVLYAPTWQQDDNGRELFPFGESQDAFIQHLSDVCRRHRATLVIRSHLNASISAMTFDNVRYCSMKDFPDTEDLLLHTDILICDWSSIAFDYLALDRPTIFLDVEPPFSHGFSLGKEYRFGDIAVDFSAMLMCLESDLQDPAAYRARHGVAHSEITRKIYGDTTDGKAALRQLERLAILMSRG